MSSANIHLRPQRRAIRGFVLTALLVIWWGACRQVAGQAATGLLGLVEGGAFVPLLAAVFLLFLMLLGFMGLDLLQGRRETLRELFDLPKRPTSRREWLIGAALGWGAVIVALLPLALRRGLHIQTWFAPRGFLAAAISLLTLATATLATETVFRGYGFRQLQDSMGKNRAAILLSAVYALIVSLTMGLTAVVISFLFAMLLATAWRRTHALWVTWGLHFAWGAALGVLFGLPLFEGSEFSNVIQAQVEGPRGLSGSGFGPIAAPWTAFVLLSAILVLVWVTGDFAWSYTHPPIVAAGYPMDVAPPPAHVAMERAAPPPLVQILPTTPEDGSRGGPLNN